MLAEIAQELVPGMCGWARVPFLAHGGSYREIEAITARRRGIEFRKQRIELRPHLEDRQGA